MRALRRAVPVAILLAASTAGAQEVESAPAPTVPVASPPDAKAESWWLRYRDARRKMEAGDFKAAADELDALAATAPDTVTATFVKQDATLCRAWANKNLVLVPHAEARRDAASSARTSGSAVVIRWPAWRGLHPPVPR